MKRAFWQFWGIFLLVLLTSYLFTALEQQNSPQVKQTKHDITQVKLTSPKIDKIKTTELAQYVGMSSRHFQEKFGQPTLTYQTAENMQWWLYNFDSQDYLRVGIDNYTNQISSLFIVGERQDIAPFSMGMSFKQLLKLSTFYANFEITANEQKFQLELSESDMNTHPLIAFANNSYAICYLEPKTKKLYALEYLNATELLRKGFYTVLSKTPLPVEFGGQVTWDDLSKAVPEDFWQTLNIKTSLAKKQSLIKDEQLTDLAMKTMTTLKQTPKAFLNKKQQKALQNMQNDEFSQVTKIDISDDPDFDKKMLTDLKEDAALNIYVLGPVFSAQDLFTDSTFYASTKEFLNAKRLGIAYDKGLLVVVTGQ